MKLYETISKIDRMHHLIKRKATGSPEAFSGRLNISKRSLHRLIDIMKESGAPIFYCKHRGSYCYEYEVEFDFGFSAKVDRQKNHAENQ